MRHESHNGEGIGYAETTFSELTLAHLARHMGTRGTRKSNSVAADSVRGQMRHIGLRPQVMMRLGPSSSEHDKSSPGFQDLAMPLFESLYNFAHWLTQNREDAEDLVQETLCKGSERLCIIPTWYKFPGMDVSSLEKHFPELTSQTGDGYYHSAPFGRGATGVADDFRYCRVDSGRSFLPRCGSECNRATANHFPRSHIAVRR